MADLRELATRINSQHYTYRNLAERCWNNHQVLEAVRHRGMAEAYEHGDPDGCSPYGCRSGTPVMAGAADG